jgi:hypothetical protein
MLQEVGAFDSQERLTPLGMHLTRLPMDVRLGRILIMGATLGCLGPTLTIVASMSSGAPWFVPSDFGERDMANKAKVSLLRGGKGTSGAIAPSDHLAIMRAYERWAKAKEDGGGTRAQRAVCDELYLSHYKMMNIQKQRRDLARDLRSIGFDARGEGQEVNSSGSGCVVYELSAKCHEVSRRTRLRRTSPLSLTACRRRFATLSSRPPSYLRSYVRIVKAAICAGLFGNVVGVRFPARKYEEVIAGAVEKDHESRALRYFAWAGPADTSIIPSTSDGAKPSATMMKMECFKCGKKGHFSRDCPLNPVQVGQRKERVFIHPSSVLFTAAEFSSPWLVFMTKVKTSKVFVRDASMADPYALLLFGGDGASCVLARDVCTPSLAGFFCFVARIYLAAISAHRVVPSLLCVRRLPAVTVKHEQRQLFVDGPWPEKNWMKFDADARVGVLIRELRSAMSLLLSRKVDEPDFRIVEHPIMVAVCTLLRTNGALRAAEGEERATVKMIHM